MNFIRTEDGITYYIRGDNRFGKLGIGNTEEDPNEHKINLNGIKKIESNGRAVVVLLKNGRIYCTGKKEHLGFNYKKTADITTFTWNQNIKDVEDIFIWSNGYGVLTRDGKVLGTGLNDGIIVTTDKYVAYGFENMIPAEIDFNKILDYGLTHLIYSDKEGGIWMQGVNYNNIIDIPEIFLHETNKTRLIKPFKLEFLNGIDIEYLKFNQTGLYVKSKDNRYYAIEKTDKRIVFRNDGSYEAGKLKEFKIDEKYNVKQFGAATGKVWFVTRDNKLYVRGDNLYGELGTGNLEAVVDWKTVGLNVKQVLATEYYGMVYINTYNMIFAAGMNKQAIFKGNNRDGKMTLFEKIGSGVTVLNMEFVQGRYLIQDKDKIYKANENEIVQIQESHVDSETFKSHGNNEVEEVFYRNKKSINSDDITRTEHTDIYQCSVSFGEEVMESIENIEVL